MLVLRNFNNRFSEYIGAFATVLLFGAAVVEFMPIFDFASELAVGTGFEEYLSVLLKALGITLAVQLTSELCRDMGASSLASNLELVGRVELLLLALPLIKELAGIASDIIKG